MPAQELAEDIRLIASHAGTALYPRAILAHAVACNLDKVRKLVRVGRAAFG